ncbi:MAG: DNA mismatch repair endonuclease MutL [Bacteroidales bacterium]|nr:DNA mismatch repair endonuclease MutL [Bacteroidales bacterium]
MSDIINILPDSVANQIAAGEVVDRPASAVKELLENAVDAGASQIQLILKDAGRTLIQVIDNGCGMSDSDARLCFERHATSKIRKSDDLFAIHTMGFRGEALASIAAIAQVELKTRLHDSELGTCVTIEGCEIKDQAPCNCSKGTSLAVKNLFYNVPARRNFLKKDTVELSHIEEIFRRVALTNCQTAFTMHHNGKMLYDLKAGNFAQRICSIYGTNYKERLFPIQESSDVVEISGYISKAEYVRKTRGEQYLFVNDRFIKHPALSAAIEKAYIDVIPERSYPSYYLKLKVDPSRIDVNIHPTKTEVKFIDEHAIFAILRAATKKALGQFTIANELNFDAPADLPLTPAPDGYIPQAPTVRINTNYNPFASTKNESRPSYSGGHSESTFTTRNEDASKWTDFFAPAKTELPIIESPQATQSVAFNMDQTEGSDIDNACFQLMNRWIVGKMKTGLLLVDQQRAHERIWYERLLNRNRTVASQQLLFPINCTFTPADADILTELMPELASRGFEMSQLGKNTFVVTATPTGIREESLQEILEQILSDYKGSMLQKFADRDQNLCKTLAKQMAVKTGNALQQAEMQQIIADLFCCHTPEISPSGKRTMMILKEKELEEMMR